MTSEGVARWSDDPPAPVDSVTDERVRLALRWAPYAVFLVIVVATFPATSRGYPTSDAVSYFSLAEHWANGRFDLAINGFWSPLLPVLLAPFAWVGVPLFLAGRIVMVAVGVFAVARLRRLMHVLGYDSPSDEFLVVGASPLVAYAAMSLVTPDLLMAALLLGYLSAMIDRRDTDPRRRGAIAGAWAAAAFFAKAYALPFVAAHLAVTLAVRLVRRSDLRQRITYTGSAALSLVVCGALWVVPLSVENASFTLTTSAGYHTEITTAGSRGNAFLWAGLIPPSNEFAVSAWEDPTTLPSPVRSDAVATEPTRERPDPIVNRVRRVIGSLEVALVAGGLLGMTALVGTLSMVWWLLSRRPQRPATKGAPDPFVDIVLAAAIYVGGLSVLVIETRYLWMPLLLTVPCTAWGIRRARLAEPDLPVRMVAAGVAAASVAGPAIGISRVVEKSSEQGRTTDELDAIVSGGDRIASSRSALSLVPGLCHRDGCEYWGAVDSDDVASLRDELASNRIDVYFAFGDDAVDLDPDAIVLSSPERRLRVFDLEALPR